MDLPTVITITIVGNGRVAYHWLIHLREQRKNNLNTAQTVEGITHYCDVVAVRWDGVGVLVRLWGDDGAVCS